jgi:serine/threonine protein kinase
MPNLAARAKSTPSFVPKYIKFVAAHLVHALSAIHKRGAIHRDLRLSNIYFDDERKPVLGGLGTVADYRSACGDVGAQDLWPPEMWRGEIQTSLGDSWQLGCGLFYLVEKQVCSPLLKSQFYSLLTDASQLPFDSVDDVCYGPLRFESDAIADPDFIDLLARVCPSLFVFVSLLTSTLLSCWTKILERG